MPGRLLIVDDDQGMCEMIEADLKGRGFISSWYTSAEEALSVLEKEEFDVVLADIQMPGMNGIELCNRIVTNRPDVPVVVITAFGSMKTAVAALRVGAYDFINKPIEMDMLSFTLERAIKHHFLQEKVKILNKMVEQSRRFEELLGESIPMQKLYNQITRIADSDG